MPPLTLARLTGIFLRISSFTFGGGNPTMAALYTELVERRKWLTADQYGLSYALARITPGTNVLAFSAGVGWQLLLWPGALAVVLAGSVPAAIISVFLTMGYESLRVHPRAMAAISGMLAAAVGMMAVGAWQLLDRHLLSGSVRRVSRAVAYCAAGFALSYFLEWSPVTVLLLAALAGALWPAEAAA